MNIVKHFLSTLVILMFSILGNANTGGVNLLVDSLELL